MSNRIAVVGSNMVDLITYVVRMPGRGETIEAPRFEMGDGGKGANQAVAAARLGQRGADGEQGRRRRIRPEHHPQLPEQWHRYAPCRCRRRRFQRRGADFRRALGREQHPDHQRRQRPSGAGRRGRRGQTICSAAT